MAEGQQEPLTLRAGFSGGIGTLEATPEHPLLVPLRIAIISGKPPGRWSWVAVRDPFTGVSKLVGSFVYSVGDRLLFFPGAEVTIESGNHDERFNSRRIDHLALDPPDPRGRHRSHLAVFGIPRKDSRGINFNTRPPAGFLVPWFTLMSPTLEEFEVLPAELRITFLPPRPNVRTFGADLLNGLGLTSAILPTAREDSFFQLDVWAGRTDNWKALASKPLSWAYKSELVKDAPPGRQNVRAIQFDIDFTLEVGLRLFCCRPQGKLDGPHVLRPNVKA